MPGSVNIGGVWKQLAKAFVNIGGAWKQVTKGYCNVGGSWKEWYSAEPMYCINRNNDTYNIIDVSTGTMEQLIRANTADLGFSGSAGNLFRFVGSGNMNGTLQKYAPITFATLVSEVINIRYPFGVFGTKNSLYVASDYENDGSVIYIRKIDQTTFSVIQLMPTQLYWEARFSGGNENKLLVFVRGKPSDSTTYIKYIDQATFTELSYSAQGTKMVGTLEGVGNEVYGWDASGKLLNQYSPTVAGVVIGSIPFSTPVYLASAKL